MKDDAFKRKADAFFRMFYNGSQHRPASLRNRGVAEILASTGVPRVNRIHRFHRFGYTSFVRHLGIDIGRTVLFNEIDIDREGMMRLELNRTQTIGKAGK